MALSVADGIEARNRMRTAAAQREAVIARAARPSQPRFALDARDAAEPAGRPSDAPHTGASAREDRTGVLKQGGTQDAPTRPDDRAAAAKPSSPQPGPPVAGPRPKAAADGNKADDTRQADGERGATDTAGEAASGTAGSATMQDDGTQAQAAGTEAGQAPSPTVIPVLPVPVPGANVAPAKGAAEVPVAGEAEDVAEAGAAQVGAAQADAGGHAAGPLRRAGAGAGFEAALTASAAEGKDAAASGPAADAAPGGPAAAGAAPAVPETKAAAATQAASPTAAQSPAVPAAPPVPLGAVPMTIGLRALGGSSRFEIRLDPVELGQIDVALDIDRARGTVGARLVVERPETLALLQRDASSLQQALAQTGLDASAGIALSLRGGEAGERRSGDGGDPGDGGQGRSPARNAATGTTQDIDASALDRTPLRRLYGLRGIDIRI